MPDGKHPEGEEDMRELMDAGEVAEQLYGRVTKSTVNMVGRMCANGTIKHAEKIGRKWYVNARLEWPGFWAEKGVESGK